MLAIRTEQMRALQAARVEQLVQHAMVRLQVNGPHLSESMPDWATQVRPCVMYGLRHFSADDDVARFAEIVLPFLRGRPANTLPEPALEMIQSASLPATRRLDNLARWAKKAVRRAV